MASPSTSLSLLRRVKDPMDQLAWDRFVGIYVPLLYQWARRIVINAEDAQDLVQDVLSKSCSLNSLFISMSEKHMSDTLVRKMDRHFWASRRKGFDQGLAKPVFDESTIEENFWRIRRTSSFDKPTKAPPGSGCSREGGNCNTP